MFDSHNHIPFSVCHDRPKVSGLSVSTRPEDWPVVFDASATNFHIQAIGVHPWFSDVSVDWRYVEQQLRDHPLLCIGEAGLDGAIPYPALDNQMNTLLKQLSLAKHYDRLISLHVVRDKGQVLNLLKSYAIRRAIIHGFTGSLEQAKAYTQQGYYLGFGPRLLLHKTPKKIKMIRECNRCFVLLESDASNSLASSTILQQVAADVASVWSCSIDAVYAQCDQNWRILWGVNNV